MWILYQISFQITKPIPTVTLSIQQEFGGSLLSISVLILAHMTVKQEPHSTIPLCPDEH
jgi:hypothetical protein